MNAKIAMIFQLVFGRDWLFFYLKILVVCEGDNVRHTIMISVMCTLPMVYMCKLKYSGKMIKSYRFSMTPVKTVESFYVFNNTYRVSLFACKSDSVLHDFFHCFHFVLYAQCVHCALFLPFECCTIWSLNSHPGNLCVQDISVRQMDSLNSIKFR